MIIFSSGILFILSKMNKASYDVRLWGYDDIAEIPHLSIQTYLDGSFQEGFTKWVDQNVKPRGLYVRNYSTIRYNLFNLGNRPIGKNKNIFETEYIDNELVINDSKDMQFKSNRDEMDEYIAKLERLDENLKKYNKFLYVYVSPSKADFDRKDIPDKYINISSEQSVKPVDYFQDRISKTDVPYRICRDEKNDLEYPAFYSTGIHWSRPYEQYESSLIIKDLSDIADKQYRNIVLKDVVSSDKAFWRDSDVYRLLNVWNKADKITYYQYNTERDINREQYDSLNFLIQGTSFGEGLINDVIELYPYDYHYYVCRDEYITDYIYNQYVFDGVWDDLNFKSILDSIDIIVIETTESELTTYSCGFVDHLNSFLDDYKPDDIVYPIVEKVDCRNYDYEMQDAIQGVYYDEGDFAWTQDYFSVSLDKQVTKNGLDIELSVPGFLFLENKEPETVTIFVNGKRCYENIFENAWSGIISIDADDYEINDRCLVEVYSSKQFNPYLLGYNDDNRYLALELVYVGGTRQ